MNNVDVIVKLRNETGAGVMDCRKAFEQGGLSYDNALRILNETALVKAAKQSDRQALEGVIEMYSHGNGRIGVMVEINTETEFASRSELFRKFAHEIALQITSTSPLYVRDEDSPADVIATLEGEAVKKARAEGKPERIIPVISGGVVEKYLNTYVLLRQPYIRDESIAISELLHRAIAQIREHIVIRRFVRWEIIPATDD
jgi:elongation factor Ts